MHKQKYTYLYIFFFSFYCLVSQAQQYRFSTYSLEEGLPQSEVIDILQDRRGSIWVGTNGGGVARFNGITFKSFNEQSGLVNNRVKKLYEDKQGNLWFLSERGITKYDGKTFKNYSENQGFSNGVEFEIAEDYEGKLWILIKKEKGSSKIVYFNNDSFTDFTMQNLQLLKDNNVNAIAINQHKDLIIKTEKGFYEYKEEKLIYSPLNDLLKEKNNVARLYGSNIDKNPRILLENLTKKTTELHLYIDGKLKFVKDLGQFNLDEFLSLSEDKAKNIWVSVDKKGFFRVDTNGNIKNFSTDNGLPINTLEVILADEYGNIWLSAYGKGLIRYVGDQFTQYYNSEGLTSGLVWAFYEDKNGKYWVGESGGNPLCSFDKNKFTHIPVEKNIYLKRVQTITETLEGELLISTVRGVWQYRAGILVDVSKKYGLPEDLHTTDICVTQNGIWFASYQDGVFYYNNQTQETIWINSKSHNLVSDLVNDIFEDSQQKIWICTNYGISIYDGGKITNYSKKNSLPSEYTINGTEDKNGNIWIATFGGLLRFSRETQKFDVITENQGILSNNLYAILVDRNNQVWVGTQIGISKLHIDAKGNILKIRNYDKNSGFTGLEANEKAIYEDKAGNIWFGTVRGLIKYNPEKDDKADEILQVNLTELQLFLQKTDWLNKELSSLHKGLIQWSFLPKDLILPYNKNYLSFQFEPVNHKYAESVEYQWILEGLENNWNKKSPKTEVIYTNLPPGNYTFKVRACLPNGACGEQITEYHFVIKPAFWQTWWFYVVIALFIGLIIVILVRQRFISVEVQKKNLQLKIAEASKALILQNDELINQKKEIEEQKVNLQQLNATKDKFFSILAHDIKGPLNSLTAFLNIMTDHLDEMSQDDIRFMSSNLNKSVKNLYSLLENVLSWSRSQMGVLEYTYTEADLYTLIENNIQLLAVSAQNKGIHLNNETIKNLKVWIDVNSINTVLRNLLSNAIKFTSTDGTVTIKTILKQKEVELQIIDTGIGMSKEVMQKIFQIDSRYTTKGTANEVGTGLGLVLVKEFVEKNGGVLQVESEEGKGSKFIFNLPLAQNKEEKEVQTLVEKS
ncbi:MAG: ATP-binding protein [Raineya sp.]|jgi:signal transduction histidine kinase/ligand-binding sensor domain-containing protein|nr:ATP-binding protein [Raineya sp.]